MRSLLIALVVVAVAVFVPAMAQQPKPVSPDATTVSEYCQTVASGTKQADALKSACEFALTVQQKFPNYICDLKVTRRDGSGFLLETTNLQVRVENEKDSYSNVRRDVTSFGDSVETPPIWSSGEFGMLLTALFVPENKASFKFTKEERLKSGPALAFSFQISDKDNKSFYVWNLNGEKRTPGYSGSIWLDKASYRPVQVQMSSTRVPSKVIQKMEAKTEYGEIPLADGTVFLLPLRAKVQALAFVKTGRKGLIEREDWISNDLEFSNCHKFRATTKIVSPE